MKKILFVTGTDTGVGKTVLTALLVAFLRREGRNALAMKPFCSGSRGDVRLLHRLQEGCLTLEEVNPFYFDKPLAPGVAGKNIPLPVAAGKIRDLARRCEILVVEGVGGLLVPLGENYTVRTLMEHLDCKAILVCANKLGAINHTLLTVEALQDVMRKELTIVMMEAKRPDISAASNVRVIRRMFSKNRVFVLPYLGPGASTASEIKKSAFFLKKTLAQIAMGGNVASFFSKNRG
jgi:dethiobiotin synthetase